MNDLACRRLMLAPLTLLVVVAACDNGGDGAPGCAEICPTGCCDVRGMCQAGTTPDNCGAGGTVCTYCQAGQVCRGGQCLADCSSTCNGCCDAQGRCQQSTVRSCGVGGVACVVCQPQTACQAGQCVPSVPTCGPSTCVGCCEADRCVLPGDDVTACGRGGRPCARCGEAEQCTGGRCQEDPCQQCAAQGQCCYEGKCFAGDTFGLCGKPGEACQSCGSGQTCRDKACVDVTCDAALCPDGCCNASGGCHLPGPSDSAACGNGGRTCKVCEADQICKAGLCVAAPKVCDPAQCDGCCDSAGQCVAGDSATACGKGGDCASCGSSQQCVDHQCTCAAASCSGCCDGAVCKSGTDNDACGKAGAACDQCTGVEVCAAGACKEICDAGTCANGCCVGTTCYLGGAADVDKCGLGGQPCKACDQAAGWLCTDGVCNNPIACGPGGADPCGDGCCKDGVCQAGTSNGACGVAGESCAVCPSWAQCEVTIFDQFCDATDSSKWRVTLARVVLDSSISWDSTSAPDVYVEVTVGGQTKTSSTVSDSYQPTFNELLLTATGLELKTEVKYVIYDDDIWPLSDQKILECSDVIYAEEFRFGYAEIPFPCGNAAANPVELIRFDLVLDTP